jgi:predicted AlkP superfamily phosphohydrolase/phosphomutase
LRDRLIAELHAERSPQTGEPLFGKVEKGEDVFHGRYAKFGPDIVCTPADWRHQVFGYQDFVSNRFVEPYSEMTGHHRPDGILFALGQRLKTGLWLDDAQLLDMAPTILHLVGLPVPTDMDGRVLEEVFTDDAWEYPQMLHVDETEEMETQTVELGEAEQKLVLARLKALGYED